MSQGTVLGLITLLLMALFAGIWIWAWSAKRRKDFERAARMPLDQNDTTDDKNHGKPG
ncbi:MAG TPA: cbb3-type cytochrome c oxidase subunit 3 [Steroidobacteraceae bacterium]|nr:cbb3-type cytochrome c oxidase subunit 3 [Steroidobacteraceae bacterium]